MTEIDYLKLKLEDKEKAFDKLHKLHMELLKKQGELEKENNMLKERIGELEFELNVVTEILYEQYATIKRLKTIREEQIQTILKQKRKIKELTVQLQTDDVCSKCKHHYLINYPESSKYYISKCKKEHEECSKEYISFCEDFELSEVKVWRRIV